MSAASVIPKRYDPFNAQSEFNNQYEYNPNIVKIQRKPHKVSCTDKTKHKLHYYLDTKQSLAHTRVSYQLCAHQEILTCERFEIH